MSAESGWANSTKVQGKGKKTKDLSSVELDFANSTKVQGKRKKNKDLSSSSSLHLTSNIGQKRKPKKQTKNDKRQTSVAITQVNEAGSGVDSRCSLPSKKNVRNRSEVTDNMSLHVVPTLSPDEISLSSLYRDISQFKEIRYLNLSCWIQSVYIYKRFCSLLTELEVEELASMYHKRQLVNSCVKMSKSAVQKSNIGVKGEHNLLDKENETGSVLDTSVLSGQLPVIVDVHRDDPLDPDVSRQLSECVSTLAYLPDGSFLNNEGKYWSSNFVESSCANYSCYVEGDHVINIEPKFCPHSKEEEPLVLFRSVTVDELDEECSNTGVACFEEHLYSLLRLQPIFESQFSHDAKLWWQDIGILHVYNIAITGFFFYLVIT